MEFIIASLFVLDIIIGLFIYNIYQTLKKHKDKQKDLSDWYRATRENILLKMLKTNQSLLALSDLMEKFAIDKADHSIVLNVHSDFINKCAKDIIELQKEITRLSKPVKKITKLVKKTKGLKNKK
jgi:hypothetical protein